MSTLESIQELPVLDTKSAGKDKASLSSGKREKRIVWKTYEKILFRIAFIFFIAISIPNSPEWYKQVFSIDWTNLHYRDLYDIARFGSGINFFGSTIFGNSLLGYANWVITALVAIGGGLIWTLVVRIRKAEKEEYRILYYWLRAV